MGKVVSAIGQSHILFDDHGVEEQAAKVFDGFKLIGERVRAAKPDLIIIISDDHMFNVTSSLQVPLAVSTGEQLIPFGDMELPQDPFPGHPEFADQFIKFASSRGFDLARLEEEGFKPDHGYVLPMMFINPLREIPTVIINVNINMTPHPTAKRCWDLGLALRDFIKTERPEAERVAVIGSGGLSHWLNIERDGQIDEEWDKKILKIFADGEYAKIAEWTSEDILKVGGNGGVEIINWLLMAATADGAKGEELFYVPMYAWKTGMGAVELNVAA